MRERRSEYNQCGRCDRRKHYARPSGPYLDVTLLRLLQTGIHGQTFLVGRAWKVLWRYGCKINKRFSYTPCYRVFIQPARYRWTQCTSLSLHVRIDNALLLLHNDQVQRLTQIHFSNLSLLTRGLFRLVLVWRSILEGNRYIREGDNFSYYYTEYFDLVIERELSSG